MTANLKAITPASLVDGVAREIRHAILTGELRPGEPFAIGELSVQFGVSHIPVREAVQRLVGQGLIQLRPSRSAVVASIDADDLRQIYHLRQLIEVDAARRACKHLTDDDLASMKRSLTAMHGLSLDDDLFWERHYEFHRTLLGAAADVWLNRMLELLWHAAERYVRLAYNESTLSDQDAHQHHAVLLEAARAHSTQRLSRAVAEHLRENERFILAGIARIASSDVAESKAEPRPTSALERIS